MFYFIIKLKKQNEEEGNIYGGLAGGQAACIVLINPMTTL